MTAYDLDIEKVLLGEIISVGDLSKANVATFKDKKHKIIYRAMLELEANKTKINFANLQAKLKETDRLEEIGGGSGLASVTISTIQLIEAKTGLDEEALKKVSQKRVGKKDFLKEGNFIEYPMAVLNAKQIGRLTKGNYVVCKDKEGRIISKVGTSDGVLTPFDYDVLTTMSSYYKETDKGKGIISFTDYDLIKRMGKEPKSYYLLLLKTKTKLTSLNISIPNYIQPEEEAEDGKDTKKKKKFSPVGVASLYVFPTSYITRSEEAPKRGGKNKYLHHNYFVVNDHYKNNIKGGYAFWLNHEVWNKLSSPLARRLYEYLKKKSGNKRYYEEHIKSLSAKMPLKISRLPRTKSTLKNALEELKAESLIKDHKFTGNVLGVSFYPNNKKQERLPTKGGPAEAVMNAMLEVGVTLGMAIKLLQEGYPLDHIQSQIKWLGERKAKNPAALLVSAIRKNYIIPATAEEKLHLKRPKETGHRFSDLVKEGKDKPVISADVLCDKFRALLEYPQAERWVMADVIIRRYKKDMPEDKLLALARSVLGKR